MGAVKNEGYCYFTVLTNEAYIPGVKALSKSLTAVGSKYRLAILIPEGRTEKLKKNEAFSRMLKENDNCFYVTAPEIPFSEELEAQLTAQKAHHWKETFFKLQVTGLTDYKKIVLLDSDMLIMNNLDHLFECPNMSAVIAGQCVNPEWKDLNSGLMVIEPSKVMNKELIDAIPATIELRKKEGLDCGDQDVFKKWASGWREHTELHLEEKYNVFFHNARACCRAHNYSITDVAVLHFVGTTKPWMKNACGLRKMLSIIKHQGFAFFCLWHKYRRIALQ